MSYLIKHKKTPRYLQRMGSKSNMPMLTSLKELARPYPTERYAEVAMDEMPSKVKTEFEVVYDDEIKP